MAAGEECKGIYFYGKFGVGKTYLLGAIANRLAERQIPSLLVHTPEFLREMKNSLSDGSFNEKMELLKTVPVLMLDDIGAENMTNWVRDEIIGVILQYRMMERLPTLYSSNYDFSMLEEHFSYSQRGPRGGKGKTNHGTDPPSYCSNFYWRRQKLQILTIKSKQTFVIDWQRFFV